MDQQPPKATPPQSPRPLQPGRARIPSPRGTLPRRTVRPYPAPPPFFTRIFLLCFRPESWAQTARYPTYVTLIPLLLVILLGAALATAGQAYRQGAALWAFAESYDKHYPPVEVASDGSLKALGPLDFPIRVPAFGLVLLVDPTGKTNPDTVYWDDTMALVTDKSVYRYDPFASRKADSVIVTRQPMTDWLPPLASLQLLPDKGQVKVVNGTSLQRFLVKMLPVAALSSILWAFLQALGDALWAALMILVLSPLIMQVAAFRGESERRVLLLPRRAAMRMVAGFLLPLVLVSAGLRAAGYGIMEMLGVFMGPVFWVAAGAALAVWTGVMARRMYGAVRPTRS